MYTYTTVVEYHFIHDGHRSVVVLATTPQAKRAASTALMAQKKREREDIIVENVRIFKTPSDFFCGFELALSGATEVMPVYHAKPSRSWGSGWFVEINIDKEIKEALSA
jgi:hypothetical protein